MPLSQDIIDATLRASHGEQAYRIIERLIDSGFDAWWVGGSVRDMALGVVPADIDIGTSATPAEVARVFPGKTQKEGSAFGSIRVKQGKTVFEVTTFREDDAASDGRHPEAVTFGTREQDAKRRDFTVNALYFHPISRELFDPFDGESDLRERLIRFIGEPAVRLKHDALRLLRAVRFRALLDGQYHPETFRALQEQASLVEVLSGERQLEELQKMLLGPHPDRALEDLWELRILERFLPELSSCKGIPQPADYHHEGDVWDHMMKCARAFREEDDIDVRLAVLFHDCGKVHTFSLKERIRFDHHASISADLATQAYERLQMPAKRREKICWLIRHHMTMGFTQLSDQRKAHWYFHPWFSDLLKVFFLDIAGTDPADFSLHDSIIADYQSFLDRHPRPEKPLLTGDEVMEILGIAPGERVGEVLHALHEAQMGKHMTTKAEAKVFVRSLKA